MCRHFGDLRPGRLPHHPKASVGGNENEMNAATKTMESFIGAKFYMALLASRM